MEIVSVRHGFWGVGGGAPAQIAMGEDLYCVPFPRMFAIGNQLSALMSSSSFSLYEVTVKYGPYGPRTVFVTGSQLWAALKDVEDVEDAKDTWATICAHDPDHALNVVAASAAAVVARKVGWMAGALFAGTIAVHRFQRRKPSSVEAAIAARRVLAAAAACACPVKSIALGALMQMSPWHLSGKVEASIADFLLPARWFTNSGTASAADAPWRLYWVSLRPSGVYFLPNVQTGDPDTVPVHVSLLGPGASPYNSEYRSDLRSVCFGMKPANWYHVQLTTGKDRVVQVKTSNDLQRAQVYAAFCKCADIENPYTLRYASRCEHAHWTKDTECTALPVFEALPRSSDRGPTYELTRDGYKVRIGTVSDAADHRHLRVKVEGDPALAAAFLFKMPATKPLPQLWPHTRVFDPWFTNVDAHKNLVEMIHAARDSVLLCTGIMELFMPVS